MRILVQFWNYYSLDLKKSRFFPQIWYLPINLSLRSKRIEYAVWKFISRTRKLQRIERFKRQCGFLCSLGVISRWIKKKLFLAQKWHLPTYVFLRPKQIEYPTWKFISRYRKLQGMECWKSKRFFLGRLWVIPQ